MQRIFAAQGLRVWDVEELPTHGGRLRVYGCHAERRSPARRELSAWTAGRGSAARPADAALLPGLPGRADRVKDDLLGFPDRPEARRAAVAAYGAAAKGNTLLNYAGVKPDLLPYVCDAAASQAGQVHAGQPYPHPARLRCCLNGGPITC